MLDAGLSERIEKAGQGHLLRFWNDLTVAERERFARQLACLDWDSVASLKNGDSQSDFGVETAAGQLKTPSHVVRSPKSDSEQADLDSARQLGVQALHAGKVAAILLAGGQGTRLGFPHPKGMFPIGPVTGKSLFEFFAAQVQALSSRYGCRIPYLIMTSDGTHQETESFFKQHSNFGLDSNDVFFFQQGYAPAVDLNSGKLLLAEKGSLCLSPDGHGGLFSALLKAGLFNEMKNRGIEYLFSHQVDNPLTKICDPIFIGLHAQYGAEVSTKVVAKTGPDEKVGVAVDLGGKTRIIEYIDLPQELANERTADGELKFWAGSTAIHLFNRTFLERVASSRSSLPWHRAIKKIPCINDCGESIQPVVENGIKFEQFIFDTLPVADLALIVEARREEEFAPLKNKEGAFSADYVRECMIKDAHKLLRSAGISIPEKAVVEIDPRFAMDVEDVLARRQDFDNWKFDRPLYLGRETSIAVPERIRGSENGFSKPVKLLRDPLVFEPYYRQQVWGGRGLSEHFKRPLPLEGPYGEAWEISPQPLHVSQVSEGELSGTGLNELWSKYPRELSGRSAVGGFPLLVKWLECRELLSLQVHPDDRMAQRVLNEPFGKSEAWVVVSTEPSARVYAGLKPGVTCETFLSHLNAGTLMECLHSFVPRPGDCISIPAGTIHAAGGGILVAEVQQSSDATFRIFDWNRLGLDGRPRLLHVERAMEAIDWNQGPISPITPLKLRSDSATNDAERLVDGNGFQLERYSVRQPLANPHQGELTIWMVLGGDGELINLVTGYKRRFPMGSTTLIPATAIGATWKPTVEGELLTLLAARIR